MRPSEINLLDEVKRIFQLQKENSIVVSKTTAGERKVKLKKLSKIISERTADIEKAVYADFRKPAPEVKLTEIFTVTTEIKHALKNIDKWMLPERVPAPITFFGSSNKILFESKRTALIISPWNFPFMLAMSPLISAVAAGCCIVLKPSEHSPNTSAVLKDILKEVFNENEVAVCEGDHEISSKLLEMPFGHIFFTGSTRVGKIVMEAASKNLSSVTLELGGKSPVIIDSTANIKKAAQRIAWGKFFNGGQTCIAPDYIIIKDNIKKEFILEMKLAVEDLYGSIENIKDCSDYCRMIHKNHANGLIEILDDAVSNGAMIEFGGDNDKNEKFIQPTLLSNVNLNSRIMKEEIFGPLLPVLTYNNFQDLLEIVKLNPDPLALYIFSKNKKFIEQVISEIPAGGVTVNDVVVHFVNVNLPFGGINNSGFGKSHGFSGFKAFSNEKPVMKQPGIIPRTFLFPPYNKTVQKLIDLTVKYF